MIAKYDDFNRFCQPVLTLTNPEGNALEICDDNYIKNHTSDEELCGGLRKLYYQYCPRIHLGRGQS